MLYYIIKVLISAIIIVLITEISKRSSLIGGIIASLPLISVLSFIWIYLDTKNTDQISDLSMNIFYLVIPSLVLFILFPVLLKKNMNFYLALGLSSGCMICFYFAMVFLLKKIGIRF